MRHEPGFATATDRAHALNARYAHHAATDVVRHSIRDAAVGRLALVSSFGAESIVLLHMVAVAAPTTPVLFLDTQMLFAETLAYQRDVARDLGLTDIRALTPRNSDVGQLDPDGTLNRTDPDRCCHIRKTRPLAKALTGFDAWITGRKRFQGGQRADLEFFEADGPRLKINPLAHWAPSDVQDYIVNNRLRRHPLVARGYPSIGCAPCTTRVAADEDARAGRWRGTDKDECGIHFVDGKIVRGPAPREDAA